MSSEYDNVKLETGYWSPSTPDSALPQHIRAKNRIIEFARTTLPKLERGPQKPLGKTGYLDGLRGFAALLVYFMHHSLWARGGGQIMENVFGYDNKYHFVCLPGIRLLFTGGHIAVCTFFVISGYVLSAKPLSLIQAGDFVKLGDNVGSALFRRWIRLYIPVIGTTFCYLTIWHLFGIWTADEPHESSWTAEVWKWYCEFKNFSYVFGRGGEPWFSYNRHVWSIPVEFKGSILIYTSLMAFSRCTRNARLWCEVGLMWYFMYITDGAWNSMFVAGMFLCDLDLLAQNNNLPRWIAKLEPYKQIIYYHFFIIAIYLAGVPAYDNNDDTVLGKSHGWYYLSLLKPQAVFDAKWFYLFWASMFLVASIPRISWLKRFFETRPCQFLGKISYALYLVHGPILRLVADRLYVAVGWSKPVHKLGLAGWKDKFPLSKAGPLGLEFNLLAVQVIVLPLTLYVAYIVTKVFDKPSVKIAQWAFQKTLAPAPQLKS